MTFLVITFSLSVFYTSFFLIKVIFQQVLTLSLKNGLTVLSSMFYYMLYIIICYISVVLILPKNICFDSNKSSAVVTLFVVCFSIYFTFCIEEFVSETRPLHVFFSYSFINEGSLVRSNKSFFQRLMFRESDVDSFFFNFPGNSFPNKIQIEKNVFQRSLIKASFENFL